MHDKRLFSVYVCRCAMVPTHKCRYVLCFSCYNEQTDGKARSRRKGFRKVNTDKCDHNVTQLNPFNDDTYFRHDYRARCGHDDNLATVCAKCGKDIMCG